MRETYHGAGPRALQAAIVLQAILDLADRQRRREAERYLQCPEAQSALEWLDYPDPDEARRRLEMHDG